MKNATNSLVNMTLAWTSVLNWQNLEVSWFKEKTFDQIDWTNCIPTNDIPVVSFKSYFEQLVR